MTDSSVKDTTEPGGGAKRKKKARAGNSRKRSRAGSWGKVAESRRARAGLGDEIVRGVERLCQAPEGVQGEGGEPSKRMLPLCLEDIGGVN